MKFSYFIDINVPRLLWISCIFIYFMWDLPVSKHAEMQQKRKIINIISNIMRSIALLNWFMQQTALFSVPRLVDLHFGKHNFCDFKFFDFYDYFCFFFQIFEHNFYLIWESTTGITFFFEPEKSHTNLVVFFLHSKFPLKTKIW